MADYIPRPDANFNDWQANLINIVVPNKTIWGISDESLEPIQSAKSWWTNAYAKASNKHNRTEADVTAKNEARAAYEKGLRTFVKSFLAYNPKVSDADRDQMGLSVHSESRRSAPSPTSKPMADIDYSSHLRHVIHFVDAATGRKDKPVGVQGCEIWTKVGGDAPMDESELTYLGVDTRSPYTVTFHGSQKGTTAYYWLRWVNTRGDVGPWSDPVSAIIT